MEPDNSNGTELIWTAPLILFIVWGSIHQKSLEYLFSKRWFIITLRITSVLYVVFFITLLLRNKL